LPGSVVTMIAPAGNEDPGPTLRGFTIRGGSTGTQIGSGPNFGGGGVYGAFSRGVVEACRIVANSALNGGGAYFLRCQVALRDTTIASNSTGGFGGGLQIFRGAMTVERVVVEDNFAVGQGGGVHLVGGQSSLVEVVIRQNTNSNLGGGLSVFPEFGAPDAPEGSSTLVVDCVIEQNTALVAGGGLWVRPGFNTVFLEGTTICDNAPDEISGSFTDLGGNTLCLCVGDITGNGIVNAADLTELLAAWGPCISGACEAADLNRDGVVNGLDLTILLGAWGPCPE